MRLFVAVWPPPPILDAVAALDRPPVERLRWTTRDQWHVTMRFLGEVPDTDVPAVVDRLAEIDASATTAVMGPVTARFGSRVLHVPVAGLDEVARAVVETTAGIGRPPVDRPFHGHLTLARIRKGTGPSPDLRRFVGQPLAGEWPVREVTLVRSHLSPKGARYEVVHRQALVAG